MVKLDPEQSMGYQVRRCHRRFDRMLNASLGPHGLKTGFWYYLRVLWIEDGLTQRQLSDLTNVVENTTVVMINGMVASGLVEQKRDIKDRRKLRITLTPKGRALEVKMMKYAININDVAHANISDDEFETCLSVLRRISENLSAAVDNI